ncbi:MAG: hypothetical protein FJX53_03525 [Alphaproteobacteria bacterium]|nr:hypothetical protein [Alphaproteobacteria bacterium]
MALTNYPGLPERMAAIRHLRKRGVPVIGFQHGVSREINRMHDAVAAYAENAVTDLFITYNEAAARISAGYVFARGRIAAAGLPRRMARAGRSDRAGDKLWYISTNHYRGTWQGLMGAMVDRDKAELEIAIVDEVLGQLDRPVFYKPYPETNYADPDPVLARIARHANIRLYGDAVDLRYLLPKIGLLISARATSTTAWCLMAERPYVLIDLPDDQPLLTEARPLFAAGLFLVNGADAEERRRLAEFLRRPMREIAADWAAKAEARRELRARYFSNADRPGASAARAIRELWRRGQ